MKSNSMRRPRRKACPCTPDLFAWARDQELLASPAVRAITRRGTSPVLALVLAELAGFALERQE